MAKYVVDTNVLLSADVREPPRFGTHLSLACRERSFRWLEDFLHKRDLLVLDEEGRILEEYQKKPRFGDFAQYFVRQVLTEMLVEFVHIDFDEAGVALLPEDLSSVVHDVADRKFVAAALADEEHPEIVNTADTDWLSWREALQARGLSCLHLCADELQEIASRKGAPR